MLPFRDVIPTRTCTEKYARYTSYKIHLREDFNRRCGYCDDLDVLCGGSRGFHIDHFRPQKKFQHLENDYSNLVYACPYCNGGKSDDWPSGHVNITIIDGKGYVDPCDVDFDNHFERYDNGRIRPKTEVGNYMYTKLKLGLRRHQLAWKYEKLANLLKALRNELKNFSGEPSIEEQLKDQYLKLSDEFFKYKYEFEETL